MLPLRERSPDKFEVARTDISGLVVQDSCHVCSIGCHGRGTDAIDRGTKYGFINVYEYKHEATVD